LTLDIPDITEKIIGCAYRVYNTMGSGFLEAVYGKCLAIEFNQAGLRAEFQKPIEVFYFGQNVGCYVADIVVEG
jgi:GxxExxY protein